MSTAFLTDRYELTMLSAALRDGIASHRAVFELFARKLPKGRRYGIVGGTGRAIEAVKNFTFTPEHLKYLEQNGVVDERTLNYLRDFKFTGNIYGYREGDVYFPNSPVLTVESTFGEAVLLETILLSIMNYDSAVASAASRMTEAAQGITLAELGSRRMTEYGAVAASRQAYINGFDATSNMEAGYLYGIPTMGTSAHAFTLAHRTEKEAFQAQIDSMGVNTTLLVDTYDIAQGIRNAIEVAGTELGGIRIDSGDLYQETQNARKLLDELGATKTKIVLSSDIDEYSIAELVERGTPVDSIGAGTRVVTGSGHVTASMVYKLVAIDDGTGMRHVAKKASGKKSVGGQKWANRSYDDDGMLTAETLSYDRRGDTQVTYFKDGHNVKNFTLEELRTIHRDAMARLPLSARSIQFGEPLLEANMEEL